MRSASFEARTQRPELALELEQARAELLAGPLAGLPAPSARIRVVELAVPGFRGFTSLDAFGEPLVVLVPGAVRHEVLHALLGQLLPVVPRWLSEGLAGFVEGEAWSAPLPAVLGWSWEGGPLAADPTLSAQAVGLVRGLAARGELAGALRALFEGRELVPPLLEAGEARFEAGPVAVETFTVARELSEAEVWLLRAEVAAARGARFEPEAREALRLDAGLIAAQALLHEPLHGEPREARDCLLLGDARRAAALDPQDLLAHLRLGWALFKSGDRAGAAAAARAALLLAPGNVSARALAAAAR